MGLGLNFGMFSTKQIILAGIYLFFMIIGVVTSLIYVYSSGVLTLVKYAFAYLFKDVSAWVDSYVRLDSLEYAERTRLTNGKKFTEKCVPAHYRGK